MFGTRTAVSVAMAVVAMVGAAAQAAVTVHPGDVITYARADVESAEVGPIRIVGARNGVFSGKAVAASNATIKGIRASVSALKTAGGEIPAENILVRYGAAWGGEWRRRRPRGMDILLETPPAQVPAAKGRAYASVWMTVTIPADAKPGEYAGGLTVEAEGLPATTIPVKLTVADWTLPEARDFRTWVGMIQSPDSLALEYKTEMWSDEHWRLIDRSFQYMSALGCRNVFIPLLARTNFGNAESMVRWIRKADGSWDYDFSRMDKYLDIAMKRLGKLEMVTFQAWELYLAPRALKRSVPFGNTEAAKAGRLALQGKGPRVTVVDPATGATEMVYLPRFEDSASEALWKPLFDELHKRMKARGLEDAMMLGMISDVWPSKQEVAMLKKVSGDLPWASHAHPGKLLGKPARGNRILYKTADMGYDAHVYALGYQVNPDKGRHYGWRHPERVVRFARNGWPNTSSWLQLRLTPMFNITGDQNGMGRLGADVWYVIRDKRGRRVGAAYHRYPEVNWRNLDIESWILAPGPDGAVGTGRLENLREGLQECEARITIESALLDPAAKRRLGAPLVKQCEALLNERQRAMWKTVWTNDADMAKLNVVRERNPIESVWHGLVKNGKKLPGYWDGAARKMRSTEAAKGHAWFQASPWRDRNARLFDLAGKVREKTLAMKAPRRK